MGIYLRFGGQYPFFHQVVNANATEAVNDPLIFEKYADVIGLVVFSFEEYQVAGQCRREVVDMFAMIPLELGIARQLIARESERHLREAWSVDAEWTFAAGKMRGIEILAGRVFKKLEVSPLAETFRLPVECKLFLHFEKLRCRYRHDTSHDNGELTL